MKSLLRTAVVLTVLILAGQNVLAATVYTFRNTTLFSRPQSETVKITDVAVDSANRVWFATNQYGVTALSNNAVARGFPLFSTLQNAGFTTAISSIAFGPVGTEEQENFFLGANGSASGILYGRHLETGPSFTIDRTLNDELNAAHSTTKVNAMGADTDQKIWIATDVGVTSVSLPTLVVSSTLYAPTSGDANVLRVVDADPVLSGGQAFFATLGRFYMINPGSPNGWLFFNDSTNLNDIGGIDVDAQGNLWVAEANGITRSRRILKYFAADLADWSGGGPEPQPIVYEFDPGNVASAFTDTRKINVLKVSPSTGEVWLGTTAGAFFQKPNLQSFMSPQLCTTGVNWASSLDDVDGLGQSCADSGTGWKPTPQATTETTLAVGESFDAMLLDQLGNAWLGSDKNVRAVIVRNLTLNGTRFIGTGATAIVKLFDEFITDPEALVVVKVEAAEENLLMTPGDPGQYSLRFGFTTSNAAVPSTPPHLFTVDPTKSNAIQVKYSYTDILGEAHTITIPATWVEIAPFEDDLLIGGPCLIKALGR